MLYTRLKKILRRGCILLLASFLLIAGGGYAYCLLQPKKVAAFVEQELREATSLPFRIAGKIRPVFFPAPGIKATKVSLAAASLAQEYSQGNAPQWIAVKRLAAYIDFWALFSGHLRLGRIVLDRPTITFAKDNTGKPLWVAPDDENIVVASSDEPLPADAEKQAPGPTTPDPTINGQHTSPQGDDIQPPEKIHAENEHSNEAAMDFPEYLHTVMLSLGEDAVGDLPDVTVTRGSVRMLSTRGKILAAVEDISLSLRPGENKDFFSFNAMLHVPAEEVQAYINLTATPYEQDSILEGNLSVFLDITPPQSRPVGAQIAVPFSWGDNGNTLYIPQFALLAEGDAVTADLYIDLKRLFCTGKVNIDNLSLPRWFLFGRNLPPGLQAALHTLRGEFDLYLDENSVAAHNLTATAGGVAVAGYVGAPDFSAPEVVVDITLPTADVDRLLPFLAVSEADIAEPAELVFPHRELVPLPERPLPEGEEPPELIDVGYDVTIYAQKAQVHDTPGGPLTVHVGPAPGDVARVSFNGDNFMSGQIAGQLDFASSYVRMKFDLKELDIAQLPENRNSRQQFGGALTGVCSIEVPVNQGSWADDWSLSADAVLKKASVLSPKTNQGSTGWHIQSAAVTAKGKGGIHAVRKDGISVFGNWDLQVKGFSNSWNPKANESIAAGFNGTLAWPVFDGIAKPAHQGIYRIHGTLEAQGSVAVPLGSVLAPLPGKLTGNMDWRLDHDTFLLESMRFSGLDSTVEGQLSLNFSGQDTLVEAQTSFAVSPRTVLARWDMLPSPAIVLPDAFTGSTRLSGSNKKLVFKDFDAALDKDKLQGEITCLLGENETATWEGVPQTPAMRRAKANPERWMASPVSTRGNTLRSPTQRGVTLRSATEHGKTADTTSQSSAKPVQPVNKPPQTGKAGQSSSVPAVWIFRLSGPYLDIDKLIPPSPADKQHISPSTEAWELNFIQGLHLDLQLQANRVKFQGTYLHNALLTGKLFQERFTSSWQSRNFYGGTAQGTAEGIFILPSQMIFTDFSLQLKDFSLRDALYDFNKSDSYGGKGSLTLQLTGGMMSNADMPRGLSGTWALSISDGTYPAFLGTETAGLRNTFSTASASGVMEKGVLLWDDFVLQGLLVDMKGGGEVNFPQRTLNITISATIAKIPTIPVRISGSFDSPGMTVRGVHMVLHTAQAAGNTVLSIFQGILSLPGQAVSGIQRIFSEPDKDTQTTPPEQTPLPTVLPEIAPPAKPTNSTGRIIIP